MIHTVEISTQIGYIQYCYLKQNNLLKNLKFNKKTLKNYNLTSTRPIENYKYPYYYLKLQLNLYQLANKEEIKDTISQSDFNIIQQNFNKIIDEINNGCIDISSDLKLWKVKRIDFKNDIILDSEKDKERLMALLKRSYIHQQYNDNKKNIWQVINNSIIINFYDKKTQLLSVNPTSSLLKNKDIDKVIRLEIQCKSKKINTLKNKYDLINSNFFDLFHRDIQADLLVYYLSQNFSFGTFYSHRKFINLIKKSSFQERTKAELIALHQQIGYSRSVYQYLNKLEPTEQKRTKELIKKMNKLNISLQPIPHSWHIEEIKIKL